MYAGDQYKRDGAYHQGTVWTWPLGQFITAYLKVNNYSPEAKKMAMRFIEPLRTILRMHALVPFPRYLTEMSR